MALTPIEQAEVYREAERFLKYHGRKMRLSTLAKAVHKNLATTHPKTWEDKTLSEHELVMAIRSQNKSGDIGEETRKTEIYLWSHRTV